MEIRIDMQRHHYPVITIAARKMPSTVAGHCSRSNRRTACFWRTAMPRATSCCGSPPPSAWRAFKEPVFLYGAGIHTAQLLDRTNLAPQVIAIADRDPKKWGQTQAGKPVISPQELFAHPAQAPVIVSSYVSEKHIVNALLKGGIEASRIVPLYAEMADPTAREAAIRSAG